jgi:hypothetical protein
MRRKQQPRRNVQAGLTNAPQERGDMQLRKSTAQFLSDG